MWFPHTFGHVWTAVASDTAAPSEAWNKVSSSLNSNKKKEEQSQASANPAHVSVLTERKGSAPEQAAGLRLPRIIQGKAISGQGGLPSFPPPRKPLTEPRGEKETSREAWTPVGRVSGAGTDFFPGGRKG